MIKLPQGAVTFLFMNIETAPELGSREIQLKSDVITDFYAMVDQLIKKEGGNLFNSVEDILSSTFRNPMDAVKAVLEIQQLLSDEASKFDLFNVRMALHTGIITESTNYQNQRPVQWGLKLLMAGREGQILISHITAELIRDLLPSDIFLHDLGPYYIDNQSSAVHLFQLNTPNISVEFQTLRYPAYRPHNLPIPPTPLIGRKREVAEVKDALLQTDVHLVTLTGAGGVGKTRLALEVATQLQDSFSHGVFLVELNSLSDPNSVILSIAHSLRLTNISTEPISVYLENYLADKQFLLILDGFEHLLSSAKDLSKLMVIAQKIKLLVTSRAALHIQGEYEYPVLPLDLPEIKLPMSKESLIQFDATKLFIQRAKAIQPDLVVTDKIAVVVADICRHLDGLPLAIELTAVQSKLFPPERILERLKRRVPMLISTMEDLPARQKTLRNTFDWSFNLLDNNARTILQRLSVFEGSFSLEAAEAVCSDQEDVMDGLATLIDYSMLQMVKNEDGFSRYKMLNTIREYAFELVENQGHGVELRMQHAVYYLSFVEQIEPELEKSKPLIWLNRLEAELPNIRSALNWALVQGEVELVARLASALTVFWDLRAHHMEGRDFLMAALTSKTFLRPDIQAKALVSAGYLSVIIMDQGSSIALLRQSLEVYRNLDDRRGIAKSQIYLGWAIAMLGDDINEANKLIKNGLEYIKTLEDQKLIAFGLHALGWVKQLGELGFKRGIFMEYSEFGWLAKDSQSLDKACALHNESLSIRRHFQDTHQIAWSVYCLGLIATARGEYEVARKFAEERLAIENFLDNKYGIASAMQQLGVIIYRQGNNSEANAYLTESMILSRDIDHKCCLAATLYCLGEIAMAEKNYLRAKKYLKEAINRYHSVSNINHLAKAYIVLAQVSLETGQDFDAREYALQSIQLATSSDDLILIVVCLNSIADSAARCGKFAWAVTLWGAAKQKSIVAYTKRVWREPPDRKQLIAKARVSLGEENYLSAWLMGSELTPEEALDEHYILHKLTSQEVRATNLTPREYEVLYLVAEGLDNKQIAEHLTIALSTVNTHLNSIYRKLGVSSRTAAMRFVVDNLEK